MDGTSNAAAIRTEWGFHNMTLEIRNRAEKVVSMFLPRRQEDETKSASRVGEDDWNVSSDMIHDSLSFYFACVSSLVTTPMTVLKI